MRRRRRVWCRLCLKGCQFGHPESILQDNKKRIDCCGTTSTIVLGNMTRLEFVAETTQANSKKELPLMKRKSAVALSIAAGALALLVSHNLPPHKLRRAISLHARHFNKMRRAVTTCIGWTCTPRDHARQCNRWRPHKPKGIDPSMPVI